MILISRSALAALTTKSPSFRAFPTLLTRYQKTAGVVQLADSSIERIRALPGVESAAAGCCTPIGSAPNAPFVIANRPLTGTFHARANMPTISPDFFDVFKIPILRGRKFTGFATHFRWKYYHDQSLG
jgi:hypothetical protein